MSSSSQTYHSAVAMIGPSLLASDMSNLAGESHRVLAAGADFLHLDVMDGHFVPNLTFGAPVIKSLRKNVPKAVFDVHLMVSNPGQWAQDMQEAGTDIFTFHIESLSSDQEVQLLIEKIKSLGMKVGIAVKPNTSVETVFPFVKDLDQVLIMTVEPGFGGQSFMADMMEKVKILREKYPALNIEVDGGLAVDTIDVAARAGANMIVAGSAVFKGDPASVISILKRSVEKYGNGKFDDSL